MSRAQTDGTMVKIGQGNAASVAYASDNFVAVGHVTDISLGGETKGLTTFQSIQDTVQQYKPNRAAELGDTEFTVEFDVTDTGRAEIREAFAAGELRWIEITLTDDAGTVLYAPAFVTNVGPVSGAVGDKMTATYTVRQTAAFTTP